MECVEGGTLDVLSQSQRRGVTIRKIIFPLVFIGLLLCMSVTSNQTSDALVWTDRGCGAFYTVYDSIVVYFTPYTGYQFELWSYHSGVSPKLLSAGVGDGHTYYVTGTVGPPEGSISFVLSMSCTYECHYCGMCDYAECTVYVKEYECNCSNQCYGDDLWAMKCVNGVCVKDYIIEENSTQCGYDPCKNVKCETVCRNYDLWLQECVNGRCVDDRLLEANSVTCGYDPCTNIVCRDVCKGYDLWSQICVDGICEDDRLLEANSETCGFDPCEGRGHCTNGVQDCSEYGIDCGGGCPFIDSDNDSVEDCKDLCLNSRCNRVDAHGCETDVDGDGVYDCEDDCPNERGNASDRGCPSNMNLILMLGGIGGVIVVAGGLIIWNLHGGLGGGGPGGPPGGGPGGPPGGGPGGPLIEEVAARKEIAEEIAKQTAKEVAQKKTGAKLAEEASKKAGTKLAEEASKKAGMKIAEEASKGIGTKIAEGAGGMGVAGVVGKELKEKYCPKCGEKLPKDSKFCSKCGYDLTQ